LLPLIFCRIHQLFRQTDAVGRRKLIQDRLNALKNNNNNNNNIDELKTKNFANPPLDDNNMYPPSDNNMDNNNHKGNVNNNEFFGLKHRSIDENKLELLIISKNYRIDESTYNGELKR
jgi:hypothetical protein